MAVVSWLSNDNEVTKNKIRDDNIAPIELNASSASKTYTVGKRFVLDSDGKLYKATQQINQGSAIITSGANANCVEDTEKILDNLGTASTKNSTSVVTESTDLVESGAVYDALGFGNKNKLPYFTEIKYNSGVTVTPNNGRYSFTGTATNAVAIKYPVTIPINSGIYRFVADGYVPISMSNITLYYNDNGTKRALDPNRTIDLSEYTITDIAFFAGQGVTTNYQNIGLMLVKESESDKSFEPYHASVEDTLRDAEVIEGKNLLPIGYTSLTRLGVTAIANKEGGLTLNGTPANDSYIPVNVDNFNAYTNKLISAGSSIIPSTGNENYKLQIRYTDGTYSNPLNNGEIFVLPKDVGFFYIPILSSVSNVKIYPMVRYATETDPTYKPYYTPLKDVVPNKVDNTVIAPVENGSTASQDYAVGSHVIRNGAFITWKNAKAQGETINDASDYTAGDVAELLTKQKITGIAVDGTILKSIVSNDSYIIPAYKLAVINLAVKVGTYAAWTICLTGLPKPNNNLSAVIANRGRSTAMLASIYAQGNMQLTNLTGSDPVEDNEIVMSITYNYDSL